MPPRTVAQRQLRYMVTRRFLITGLGAMAAMSAAHARPARRRRDPDDLPYGDDPLAWEGYEAEPYGPMSATGGSIYEDWYVGSIPDRPFDIPVVDPERIPPAYRRQTVAYSGPGHPGTISIDTSGWVCVVRHSSGQAQGEVAVVDAT